MEEICFLDEKDGSIVQATTQTRHSKSDVTPGVPETRAKKHIWTDTETRYLLALYEEHYPLVQAHKLKSQKHMWKVISKKLNFDHVQCENRFKHLKRMLANKHTNIGGTGKKARPAYEKDLEVLLDGSTSPASVKLMQKTMMTATSSDLARRYKALWSKEIESIAEFREALLRIKTEKLALLRELSMRK